MRCKQLISRSMACLLLVSCAFSACNKSSKKSNSNPPVAPVQPGTPTPTPSPTPVAIPDKWLGDWQSLFSDSKYAGNITYSIRADGRIFISLLMINKGRNVINAERQEWSASYDGKGSGMNLQLVRSSCAANKKETVLHVLSVAGSTDMIDIRENITPNSFKVRRLKNGLTQDVHTATDIRGYKIVEGCFASGRLDQFVPSQTVGDRT